MLTRVRLLFVWAILLLLVMASTAFAQPGPGTQDSDPFWNASYWNNTTFTGNPAFTRSEKDLNWDWGSGSPHSSINANQFSAVWTRYLDLAAGTYRFTTTSDDGIRVYVDNKLIINEWHDHAAHTYTADVALNSGHHMIMVEYYENQGLAVAKVSWTNAPETIYNWRGEYYNNTSLSGQPALVRDDGYVDFNWVNGSPAPIISNDRFSVRWTRALDFVSGNYRFSSTTDDGVRLWVNGHLLIDQWHDQAAATYSGTIYLSGRTEVKMEYYENAGLAVARLQWAQVSEPPPPPPPPPGGSLVVDDLDPGFVKGGSPSAWRTVNEGYNGRLTWTRNNDVQRAGYNWARWYPTLSAGRYEVFVYIPDRYSTTSAARYWVSHRDGFTLRIVNQSAAGGQWVSLGTYWFRGNSSDYVSLSDITYEPYISRLIAFDAMKWEPR